MHPGHASARNERVAVRGADYFRRLGSSSRPRDKAPAVLTFRWEEGAPGCTFSRDDDGKYRYGFWTSDFGIVLAVDSQELEKVRRRAQPMFAVLLTVHYRGKDSLDVAPGKITLEFVKHYHDVHACARSGQSRNQAAERCRYLERRDRA